MSGILRYASLGRLKLVLGLAVMGLVFASTASAQAQQLDTVVASGQTAVLNSGVTQYWNINVNASSGPQGQNLTGSPASFGWWDETVWGQVTCLKVTGPDHGVGGLGTATTAIVSIHGYMTLAGSVFPGDFEVQMIDYGGNGRDVFGTTGGNAPYGDCSGKGVTFNNATLSNGRAVVNDAPTTASFTTNPSPATVGRPITFDASSSTCAAAPCTYAWSDGAHTLGAGTPLTFTFHYAGVKHVLLTMTDALGVKSSVQHNLRVSAPAPDMARFTMTPSPSTVGTSVAFDASSSTCAAAPCTYAWSDGAHTLGAGTPLTFTFHYAGVKHVLLTMTDALGVKFSVQHDLQVLRRSGS